jgi:hypothetical protein
MVNKCLTHPIILTPIDLTYHSVVIDLSCEEPLIRGKSIGTVPMIDEGPGRDQWQAGQPTSQALACHSEFDEDASDL